MKKSVKKCFPKKVRKVMHEYKAHKLSTRAGKVTKRKQALAIALSEARKKC
jgi:hypothetical protein